MDSFYGMFYLKDRLHSPQKSPYSYKVSHLISVIRDRNFTVRVVQMPSHLGIRDNEVANSIARLVSRLPYIVHPGVPCDDLFAVSGRDFEAWCYFLRPYVGSVEGRGGYFDRVPFKSLRSWFQDLRFLGASLLWLSVWEHLTCVLELEPTFGGWVRYLMPDVTMVRS